MSVRAFFSEDSKLRTTESVGRIESGTGAEIVVAMRHRVASRRVAVAVGALLSALVAFVAAWLSPVAYATRLMPLDAVLGGILGAFAAARSATIARWLTPSSMRRNAVRAAANRAFGEHGIERTRDRTGILVLASVEEHEVAIVADDGIPPSVVSTDLERAASAMRDALRAKDFPRFLAALESMATPLASAVPRRDDDTNELCDAPV